MGERAGRPRWSRRFLWSAMFLWIAFWIAMVIVVVGWVTR